MKNSMPYPSKTGNVTATATDTDTPDGPEHDVEVVGPSSIASDASSASGRERGFDMDEFQLTHSGENASAATSAAPTPARRDRRLDEFMGKFSSSTTEDQEDEPAESRDRNRALLPPSSLALVPDRQYSQPGAFRVGEKSETTFSLFYIFASSGCPFVDWEQSCFYV
jgi:hypothetical protein